jgi:hypothetical protein
MRLSSMERDDMQDDVQCGREPAVVASVKLVRVDADQRAR